MEKNSRIPLPGGWYMLQNEDGYYHLHDSEYVYGEAFNSPIDAQAFAAAMQPQPALEARVKQLEQELGYYREPKSDLGQRIKAYVTVHPKATVRQVGKAVGCNNPSNVHYHMRRNIALANKDKSHG